MMKRLCVKGELRWRERCGGWAAWCEAAAVVKRLWVEGELRWRETAVVVGLWAAVVWRRSAVVCGGFGVVCCGQRGAKTKV
ncbi:hypothetical protein GCM10009743_12720 [Kribbella swartbergensis]